MLQYHNYKYYFVIRLHLIPLNSGKRVSSLTKQSPSCEVLGLLPQGHKEHSPGSIGQTAASPAFNSPLLFSGAGRELAYMLPFDAAVSAFKS